MRIALLALLAAACGSAFAEGTCTYTYNPYAKRVDSRCQGIPQMQLGVHERALLTSGKAKVCLIKVERVGPRQVQALPPECK
jgi:hypothetical protein